jgi:hypothetical protein
MERIACEHPQIFWILYLMGEEKKKILLNLLSVIQPSKELQRQYKIAILITNYF